MSKTKRNSTPPVLASWLLEKAASRLEDYSVFGDFSEEFYELAESKGIVYARFWFNFQMLRSLPKLIMLTLSWNLAMGANYLKIAARNALRFKTYSIINITGLSLGLTAFMLISAWVFYQFSYDDYHKNAENIYRVNQITNLENSSTTSSRTPGLLAEALQAGFPEIALAARHAWTGERVISNDDVRDYERFVICVDESFLAIFTVNIIKGNQDNPLADPYSILLTESSAEKYFGEQNPVGRTLELEDRFTFTVTAVIEDVPENSHLYYDLIVPFGIVKELGWDTETWKFSMASTYLLLNGKVDSREMNEKLSGYILKHDAETNLELTLQPLDEIFLYSNFDNPGAPGRIRNVYVFAVVGILILGMACINFINLSTARAEKRAKEISIRKVTGAQRPQLVIQFLSEAFFMTAAALCLVPVLLALVLPVFNELTGEEFLFTGFLAKEFILFAVMSVFGACLLSGAYPALYLSSFREIKTLHSGRGSSTRNSTLRKTLSFIQVGISFLLIISAMVIYEQTSFLKQKYLGFDTDNILVIPLGIGNLENGNIYRSMKDALKQSPYIESVSGSFTSLWSFGTPPQNIMYNGRRLNEATPVTMTSVDYGFIETMGIEVREGRSFSDEFGSDRRKWIINERFAELMESEKQIDELLTIWNIEGPVIGVVKDFNIEPVTNASVMPIVIFLHETGINYIYIRLNPENSVQALAAVEESWNRISPGSPFKYAFLEDEFSEQFTELDNLERIIQDFTYIAIIIACLGLIGLASFTAENRTKEIGIRKILGSTEPQLLFLLCRDYLKIAVYAGIVATPAAWYLADMWLRSFPYRITPAWTAFALSGLAVLLFVLLSVAVQTIRAARANPVDSLRRE